MKVPVADSINVDASNIADRDQADVMSREQTALMLVQPMHDRLWQRHVGSLGEKLVQSSLLDGRPPIVDLGLDCVQGSERWGRKKQIHAFAEVGHFGKDVRPSSKQPQNRRVKVELALGHPELAWPRHRLFLLRFNNHVREVEETAIEVEHHADCAGERDQRCDEQYRPDDRKPSRHADAKLQSSAG